MQRDHNDAKSSLASNVASAEQQMLRLICGFQATQIVRVLAILRVPDLLGEEPFHIDRVGAVLNTDPLATARLMRAAGALGLVSIDHDDICRTSQLLETLRSDRPGSMRSLAIGLTAKNSWLPMGNLVEAVRSGQCQSVPTLGSGFFEYFENIPQDAEQFGLAMSYVSTTLAERVLDVADIARSNLVVDIGGGSGDLAKVFLRTNPGMHGIVFDRYPPPSTRGVDDGEVGLEGRLTYQQGDFFTDVPEGDVHLLKWVLHDWSDEECEVVLRNCLHSLREGGRLFVIELSIESDHDNTAWSYAVDTGMLAFLHGRERSVSEYEQLLRRSGFSVVRHSTVGTELYTFNVIEAEAA